MGWGEPSLLYSRRKPDRPPAQPCPLEFAPSFGPTVRSGTSRLATFVETKTSLRGTRTAAPASSAALRNALPSRISARPTP